MLIALNMVRIRLRRLRLLSLIFIIVQTCVFTPKVNSCMGLVPTLRHGCLITMGHIVVVVRRSRTSHAPVLDVTKLHAVAPYGPNLLPHSWNVDHICYFIAMKLIVPSLDTHYVHQDGTSMMMFSQF